MKRSLFGLDNYKEMCEDVLIVLHGQHTVVILAWQVKDFHMHKVSLKGGGALDD